VPESKSQLLLSSEIKNKNRLIKIKIIKANKKRE